MRWQGSVFFAPQRTQYAWAFLKYYNRAWRLLVLDNDGAAVIDDFNADRRKDFYKPNTHFGVATIR